MVVGDHGDDVREPDVAGRQLQEEYERLRAVYRLASALNRAESLETINQIALDQGQAVLHADGAAILLYDEGGAGEIVAHDGLPETYLRSADQHDYWPKVAAEEAQPVFIPAAGSAALAETTRAALDAAGIAALAIFPLTSRECVIGGLAVTYRAARAFTAAEREVGQAIADHVAIAIARRQVETELRAARREMAQRVEDRMVLLKEQIARRKEAEEALQRESAYVRLLQEIAVAANEADAVDAVLQFALDEICAHMKWPVGHVYMMTEKGHLEPTDLWHCESDRFDAFVQLTGETRFELGQGWLGEVAASGKPGWNRDVSQDPNFVRRSADSDLGLRASFAFPVMVEGEVATVLEFFSPEAVDPDEEFLQLMENIATQLSRVIERKRARERLQHSEAMLAQAERLARLGSWEWDTRTNEVRWSAEMHRIYGIKPGAYSGAYEDFLTRVHPDDRARVNAAVESAARQARPFSFYHRIVRPDGEERVLRAQGKPLHNDDGEMVGMVGTGQDVTDLMRVQEELQLNARQLDALHEMGLAVTSTLDQDKVFKEVLDKLLPLLGAEGVFVLLLQGDELVFSATNHTGEYDPSGRRVPATAGVAGDVLRTGEGIAIRGAEADRRAFRDVVTPAGSRPGALLVAPLRLRGTTIGVLEAIHQQPDGFKEGDLQLLEAAASLTAVAVQNARLFARIRNSQQRLRRLTQQVVNAQEEERRRLARELHDQAGQSLTALKLNLEMIMAALPPSLDTVQQSMAEVVAVADETMEQIRRLSHGLRPPALERFGLGSAVEGLCTELGERSPLQVTYEVAPMPSLPDDVAISLYRVLQEATTNIVRHAEAKSVHVALTREENAIQLKIVDDGKGFSREAAARFENGGGIGLETMHERIELFDGTFTVDSAAGRGTTIIARVPYAPRA